MPSSGRPGKDEYGEFFGTYVDYVPVDDIVLFLADQAIVCRDLFLSIDETTAHTVHPPYTWTLKQVLGHLIDGEKIFGCRLHRIACGDSTELPGFQHEPYVAALDYDQVRFDDLANEFLAIRSANVSFCKRLSPEAWSRSGTASGCRFTVRGKAFVIGGHVQHHLNIMQKRIS